MVNEKLVELENELKLMKWDMFGFSEVRHDDETNGTSVRILIVF